jgi:hypothetical protein
MPQIHEAEARKLDRLVIGSGAVLGGAESAMPQATHEADALQRSQYAGCGARPEPATFGL